jgi:hypothetical protein
LYKIYTAALDLDDDGTGAKAVVNMGYDTEIAYLF